MRFVAFLLGCSVLCALCTAQPVIVNGNPGYSASSPYNLLYSPRTVVTFKGRVSGIQIAPPMRGMGKVVTLIVKANNGGTTIVDLGPEWFVNNQLTKVKLNDRIQVTGSKVIVDGRGIILAEMIVKNKDVLTLRRPSGRPYWDAVMVAANVVAPTGPNVVAGQIVGVDTIVDPLLGSISRIMIQTENGVVPIALGPSWYVGGQDVQFALGDVVRASIFTGQIPNWNDVNARFATSVWRGSQYIMLRDMNGNPFWFPIGG